MEFYPVNPILKMSMTVIQAPDEGVKSECLYNEIFYARHTAFTASIFMYKSRCGQDQGWNDYNLKAIINLIKTHINP